MKTAFHPISHIFMIDISDLCVSPDMICPSLAVLESCRNANLHSLVYLIWPTFGGTNVRGGGSFFCLFMGSLGFM